MLLVSAVALVDIDGRVLLAQRPEGLGDVGRLRAGKSKGAGGRRQFCGLGRPLRVLRLFTRGRAAQGGPLEFYSRGRGDGHHHRGRQEGAADQGREDAARQVVVPRRRGARIAGAQACVPGVLPAVRGARAHTAHVP